MIMSFQFIFVIYCLFLSPTPFAVGNEVNSDLSSPSEVANTVQKAITQQAENVDDVNSLLLSAQKAILELQNALKMQEEKLKELQVLNIEKSQVAEPPTERSVKVDISATRQDIPSPSQVNVLSDNRSDVSWAAHTHQTNEFECNWSNSFPSVAKLLPGARVTALAMLFEHSVTFEPRYVALGDSEGNLHLVNRSGEMLQKLFTGTDSAITAISSFPRMRNGTMILTGHANGEIRIHKLMEEARPGSKEYTIADFAAQGIFAPLEQADVDANRLVVNGISVVPTRTITSDSCQSGGSCSVPISHLMTYRPSSSSRSGRLIVSVDELGWVRLYKENGTLKFSTPSNASVLTVHIVGKLVVVLLESHVSVLSLSTQRFLRDHQCQNLNNTRLLAATFDTVRSFRAYAVSEEGDLLVMLVPHESRMSTCKVVRAVPLGLPLGPMTLTSIKGYLLLAHKQGMIVINITTTSKIGPRIVLSEPYSNLGLEEPQAMGFDGAAALPLIAATRYGLIAAADKVNGTQLLLSSLPSARPPGGAPRWWIMPLFILATVGMIAYQLYRKNSKKPPTRADYEEMMRRKAALKQAVGRQFERRDLDNRDRGSYRQLENGSRTSKRSPTGGAGTPKGPLVDINPPWGHDYKPRAHGGGRGPQEMDDPDHEGLYGDEYEDQEEW